ncbi:MAG: hypothetical protein CVT76_01580 [Alphaproteobacteria bacterium HGW-Alphaproteobacteria-15]|nr:MAG: hypothetical protein CVT76_01580 [Alphaproteobacteria bacterium HGW-Alphaproteobacteria-15]
MKSSNVTMNGRRVSSGTAFQLWIASKPGSGTKVTASAHLKTRRKRARGVSARSTKRAFDWPITIEK